MSLVHLVETPPMRAAFAAAVRPDHVRPDARGWECLVPYEGAAGVARAATSGAAFDYLFRFRLARNARERGTRAVSFRWVAEAALDVLAAHGGHPEAHARQTRHMAVARELVGNWVAGDDAAYPRVVDVAQWLARQDVWFRTDRRDFDRRPGVDARVREDLLRLDRVLVEADPFPDASLLLLNPTFVGAHLTDGADADAVADDAVFELKTVGEAGVKVGFLRQLVGYAALQAHHGGIDLGEGRVHAGPFARIGVYFARHGRRCDVALDDLLLGDGLASYARAIAEAPGRDPGHAAVPAPTC